MRTRRCLLVASLVLAWAPGVSAQPEIRWGGAVQTDTHLRVNEVGGGTYYGPAPLEPGVARNEARLKLKMDALGDRFAGVADVDFVWLGVSRDLENLEDLGLREKVDPYRLETHGLYIDAPDVFGEGLDLRIGFQKVMWGVGDQFNPTNNLNPEDLEDPLLFGEQQASLMVKFDWHESFGDDNELTFTAVVVPVFKPALLPGSASLGLAQTDRLPFVEPTWNQVIASQQALSTGLGMPAVVNEVTPIIPEPTLENMQAAAAISTRLGDHDIALSYFVGRHDLPVATRQSTVATADPVCDPSDDSDCVNPLLTNVELSYPRMQVVGFNMTGEIDLLGWISDKVHPLGYRLEVGVFFPERERLRLFQDLSANTMLGALVPVGETDYAGVPGSNGEAPEVLSDEPFSKWVLGLDYTFGEHVYVNAQWVHGFTDEFGAGDFISEGYQVRSSGAVTEDVDALFPCALPGDDGSTCGESLQIPRIGDYLVLGTDFKFMDQSALLRLFTIMALNGVYEDTYDADLGERVRTHHGPFSKKGLSVVVFPSIGYNFGDGLEMTLGALFNIGEPHTKFGDPATGGNLAWGRASYRF